MPELDSGIYTGELNGLAVLLAAVDLREEEIVSSFREIIHGAFSHTTGSQLIEVLLDSSEAMSLCTIASRCNVSKRHVLPEGDIRVVLERLEETGLVVRVGCAAKPRYRLDDTDRRFKFLSKIYRPPRLEGRGLIVAAQPKVKR